MIERTVHPGACAMSEALLCADDDARAVLDWVFEEQEALLAASKADPGEARRRVVARFPELAGCLGGAAVKARLNRALRFAVKNQLPVLVPQLYVGGTKLCDEDTDLGLEFMLPRLIAHAKAPPRQGRASGGR
jgi:hypothetical protein